MSEAAHMAEEMKNRLAALPNLGPDPEAETIAKQRAIEAAQDKMGQYFNPHDRQGIEIALGTFITELIRLDEQGEHLWQQ